MTDTATEVQKGFIRLPISKLVKAAWNYKTENEFKQRALEENIKRNGQVENILVRLLDTGFFEVVNGNHRLDAFAAVGVQEIMCFNFGVISDASARRVAVETNETRFDSDPMKLAETLKDMTAEFPKEDLLKSLPFSAEELDAQLKLLTHDFNETQDPVTEPHDPGTGGEAWVDYSVSLPQAVADRLTNQIERVKKLLHPGEDVSARSSVQSIEAIVVHLEQSSDSDIL